MSSKHQYNQAGTTSSKTNSRLGDIEHLMQLSENLNHLCMNEEYSDVVLVVEGQKLFAHKVCFLL